MAGEATTRVLGILGGMGPLATVDLVEKIIRLTCAERDQDHIPLVIWSDPRVPPRTEAILGGGASPLPAMSRGLRALEAAGASAAAIACNTAHHWFEAMQAATSLELLHVADAVADELARRGAGPRRVGLLATAGTLAAGFYQTRLAAAGYETLVPDARAQEERVHAGIRAVKAGDPEAGRAGLTAAAEELLARGAGAVVLACTEVPIALRGAPPAVLGRCLDATEALARLCLAWAREAGRRDAHTVGT